MSLGTSLSIPEGDQH